MINNEEFGLKIAENPREALIQEVIDNAEKRILQLKLSVEIEENTLKYLKSSIKA